MNKLEQLAVLQKELLDTKNRVTALENIFKNSPPILRGGVQSIGTAAASVLTTKGDMATYGTSRARIGVGTNDHVVTADSGETLGIKWAAVAAGLSLGTEAETSPVSQDGEGAVTANLLSFGNLVTLPTTADFYMISGIEWENGATVDGNTRAYVALVDVQPMVETGVEYVAQTASTANSGASQIQRANTIGSMILAGGTKIIGCLGTDSATHEWRGLTVSSRNNRKPHTFGNLSSFLGGAWTATTREYSIKIYFRPIA